MTIISPRSQPRFEFEKCAVPVVYCIYRVFLWVFSVWFFPYFLDFQLCIFFVEYYFRMMYRVAFRKDLEIIKKE